MNHHFRRVKRIRFIALVICSLAFVVIMFKWATQAQTAGTHATGQVEQELKILLNEQTQAWNRGDIRAFMKAYWQSPEMTFSSGGKTERGWQPTLDRYLKKYPDREAMGRLTFSKLETSLLSSDVALMLGDWQLDKETPARGNFSLVWKRFDEGWRIVHDHTSSAID